MDFTSGNTREQVADLLIKASNTLNTSGDWTDSASLIARALELTRSVKATTPEAKEERRGSQQEPAGDDRVDGRAFPRLPIA